MTGTNEKPQDAEQALTWALELLGVCRQNPRFIAEGVTSVLAGVGLELTLKEIETE